MDPESGTRVLGRCRTVCCATMKNLKGQPGGGTNGRQPEVPERKDLESEIR